MAEITPEQARAIAAVISRATAPLATALREFSLSLERWHRDAFEPIARRMLHRRLVRALRAEIERRT